MSGKISLAFRRRGAAVTAFALTLVVAVTLWGGTNGAPGPVDLSVLRSVDYDYVQFASPEELASFVDVVAVGTVDGFTKGAELQTPDSPQPEGYVVMSIQVETFLDGLPPGAGGGRLHVALPQGRLLIDDFRAALPKETRVAMFLQQLDVDSLAGGVGRVLGWQRGRPEGTRLYQPYPQGLVFEGQRRIVGGIDELPTGPEWSELKGIDDLVERLRNA